MSFMRTRISVWFLIFEALGPGPALRAQTAGAPKILNVTLTSGRPGTEVTIFGTGFGGERAGGSVWLGADVASVVSWSDTSIVATVKSPTKTGVVRVNQRSLWSNAVAFSVPTPAISSVFPLTGVPGTEVTITGTNFGDVQGRGLVSLGTANGVIQRWTDTQIIALVAGGATSGNVRVVQDGVASDGVAFDVDTLHIKSVTPLVALPGSPITIKGGGFGTYGTVLLGSVEGQIISWTDREVLALLAPGSVSGVVRIQQNGVWSNPVCIIVPSLSGPNQTLAPCYRAVEVGDTHQEQAVSGKVISVKGLTWRSSDPNVVRLSNEDPPTLFAVSPGHAIITAGAASAMIDVYPR
jgi:hypothetical protein